MEGVCHHPNGDPRRHVRSGCHRIGGGSGGGGAALDHPRCLRRGSGPDGNAGAGCKWSALPVSRGLSRSQPRSKVCRQPRLSCGRRNSPTTNSDYGVPLTTEHADDAHGGQVAGRGRVLPGNHFPRCLPGCRPPQPASLDRTGPLADWGGGSRLSTRAWRIILAYFELLITGKNIWIWPESIITFTRSSPHQAPPGKVSEENTRRYSSALCGNRYDNW